MEKTAAERLEYIREIKKAHSLSNKDIIRMLDERGEYISETTIKKIFAENNNDFRFSTIAPIYSALCDVYGDTTHKEETDIKKLQNIITSRNKRIDDLQMQLEEQEKQHKFQAQLYQERKENYLHTIEILKEQIKSKDETINKLLDYITENEK